MTDRDEIHFTGQEPGRYFEPGCHDATRASHRNGAAVWRYFNANANHPPRMSVRAAIWRLMPWGGVALMGGVTVYWLVRNMGVL